MYDYMEWTFAFMPGFYHRTDVYWSKGIAIDIKLHGQ
jgi:hypothetical protein